MKINRKGMAPITMVIMTVAIVAVLGILATGAYYYSKTVPAPASSSTQPVASSTTPAPTTASLSPMSGPVGTVVTIHGNGFATTDNTVTINGMVSASLKNLSSADGKTITFTVPSSLGPNCKPNEMCAQYLIEVTDNTYTVAVISGDVTQTIGTFTVTGGVKLPM